MLVKSGYTPLHIAAEQGHLKVVDLLLDAQADPTLLDQVCNIFLFFEWKKLFIVKAPFLCFDIRQDEMRGRLQKRAKFKSAYM